MEPNLTISYSSQRANGAMGVGWAVVGLSSITRCSATIAQDNYLQRPRHIETDKICLDGKRLVTLPQDDDAYGDLGTKYRTEINDFSLTEQKDGDLNDPSTWFEIKEKNGLIKHYGSQDSAFRIAPQSNTPISSWAIKTITDRYGNRVIFNYGYDGITNEHYPTTIQYTENNSLGKPAYNEVEFEYDLARPDQSERFQPGSGQKTINARRLLRIKIFADNQIVREYRFNYEVGKLTSRSRLSSVTECAWQVAPVYDWDCLNPTLFDYQDNLVASTSQGFVEDSRYAPPGIFTSFGGNDEPRAQVIDVNGDGRPDWVEGYEDCPCPVWINDETENGYFTWHRSPQYDLPVELYSINTEPVSQLIDLNGDGLADYVASSSITNHHNNDAYINTGSGWQANSAFRLPGRMFQQSGEHSHVQVGFLVDVDGDTLPDYVRGTGTNINYSDFTGPVWRSQYGHYRLPRPLVNNGDSEGQLFDINGDGLPDLVYAHLNDNQQLFSEVYINNGKGNWVDTPSYSLPQALFFQNVQLARFIDLNADGLPDYIATSTSGISTAYLNTGLGWAADNSYLPPNYDDASSVFVDINRDGRKDAVFSNDGLAYGLNNIYFNLPTAPCGAPGCRWASTSEYQEFRGATGVPYTLFGTVGTSQALGTFADVNADGLPDALFATNYNGNEYKVAFVNKARATPDLLTHVENGVGSRVYVQYAMLSDEDIYDPGTIGPAGAYNFPERAVVGPTFPVVEAAVVAAPNNSSDSRRTTYTYAKGRFDSLGRGFRGFETVTATQPNRAIRERTQYYVKFPHSGTPQQIDLLKIYERSCDDCDDPWDESLIRQTYNARNNDSGDFGSYFPHITQTMIRHYTPSRFSAARFGNPPIFSAAQKWS